jgi:hypothetical protein
MANLTGKGGFGDHPENINREGAPTRGQDWRRTIKRITDMTREEAIEYVGKKSKIGRLLKELPADLPIKDALVFISVIQYGRDPNPRMLSVLMDREEGKPAQPITGDPNNPLKVIIEYANEDSEDMPSETSSGAEANQDDAQEV